MLGADDKLAITQGGSMPQFMHLPASQILLGNQQMLQKVGLDHNTVEVRRFGCFSSRRQPCKLQLISAWRKLQTKDLQWISLYSRGAAKVATTLMAGMYDVLT